MKNKNGREYENEQFQTGYFYAPYIPIMSAPDIALTVVKDESSEWKVLDIPAEMWRGMIGATMDAATKVAVSGRDDDVVWNVPQASDEDKAVEAMADGICREIDDMIIEEILEQSKKETEDDYDRAMGILG